MLNHVLWIIFFALCFRFTSASRHWFSEAFVYCSSLKIRMFNGVKNEKLHQKQISVCVLISFSLRSTKPTVLKRKLQSGSNVQIHPGGTIKHRRRNNRHKLSIVISSAFDCLLTWAEMPVQHFS
jgi:hypothetical protein